METQHNLHIRQSITYLHVIMASVVMLNVVAPFELAKVPGFFHFKCAHQSAIHYYR
jgi:hypothetical protein